MNDKDWWSPGEIKFTYPQVQWLLRHYNLLVVGQWPHPDGSSGYTDITGIQLTRGRRKWAYFETPCDVAAELDERMSRLGALGSIIRDLYVHGWSQEKVGKWWGISQPRVHEWQRLGMYYMTGRNRKPLDKLR